MHIPWRQYASACWTPYALSLLFGGTAAFLVFPHWHDLWRMPPGAPRNPDFAAHVVGARYFLFGGWHRHLLVAPALDVPYGVNVGFTDSLPLFLLLLKPFAAWLPRDFQPVTGGLAIAWTLQPVGAVFLLRSLGEVRLLPALATAVLSIATPTFLVRLDHEALSAHCIIMAAMGLSLRLTDTARPLRTTLAWATALPGLSLLVHPYLLIMAAAILAAAPLTLLIRRARRLWPVLAGLAAGALAALGLAQALGYFAPGGAAEGFGFYSMNLLSPVWPGGSHVFGRPIPDIDATGGQYEGYQYLGLGLLLAIVICALVRGREIANCLARQPGMVLACLTLTILALSCRIYAGNLLIGNWDAPRMFGTVRASGRLFWPVTYLLEAASVATLASLPLRFAILSLVALSSLQVFDVLDLLASDRWVLHRTDPLTFDADGLQRSLAGGKELVILPPWPCEATASGVRQLMDVIYVASRTLIPINTMYTARAAHPPRCDVADQAQRPLKPGEVRVILAGHAALMAVIPDKARVCRALGPLTVCAL